MPLASQISPLGQLIGDLRRLVGPFRLLISRLRRRLSPLATDKVSKTVLDEKFENINKDVNEMRTGSGIGLASERQSVEINENEVPVFPTEMMTLSISLHRISFNL